MNSKPARLFGFSRSVPTHKDADNPHVLHMSDAIVILEHAVGSRGIDKKVTTYLLR